MFPKIVSDSDKDVHSKTDEEIIAIFYSEVNKDTTLSSFKREIRRFMFWLQYQDDSLRLKDVSFIHVKAYRDMLMDIPESAIADKTVKYYSDKHPDGKNPEWRPFKKKALAPKSIRAAMNLLASFGNWLVNHGYIPANPFTMVSREPSQGKKSAKDKLAKDVNTSRHFSVKEMYWIMFAIDKLIEEASQAQDTQRAQDWRRFKFIFTFLRRTGLRREEMTEISWDYIDRTARDDGAEMHILKGIGKGDKTFFVPLHYEAYAALQDYKALLKEQNIGIKGYRVKEEILLNRHGSKRITPKTLHVHIKEGFQDIALYIKYNVKDWPVNKENQVNFVELIERLNEASAHWLRHSAITENAHKFKNLKSLQEFARHSDINTSSIYWHSEDSDMHREMNDEV